MEKDVLANHLPYMEIDHHVHSVRSISPGDVVTFNYKLKERYVFVLNTDYEKKLHGITLEKIDRNELLPLFHDVYLTPDPRAFYTRIQGLVEKTDAYRTYNIPEISSMVLQKYKR